LGFAPAAAKHRIDANRKAAKGPSILEFWRNHWHVCRIALVKRPRDASRIGHFE